MIRAAKRNYLFIITFPLLACASICMHRNPAAAAAAAGAGEEDEEKPEGQEEAEEVNDKNNDKEAAASSARIVCMRRGPPREGYMFIEENKFLRTLDKYINEPKGNVGKIYRRLLGKYYCRYTP